MCSHVCFYIHKSFNISENPPGPDEVEGPYPTVVSSQQGHKILIVQASSYSRYLGNITISLDDKGEVTSWDGAPIFLDTSLPQGKICHEDHFIIKRQIIYCALFESET